MTHIQRLRWVGFGSLAAVAVLAGGCGSGSAAVNRPAPTTTPATVGTAGPGGKAQVVMRALEFSPTEIDAKVGQTVTWTNEDSSPHNVTYVSGPRFTSSPRVLKPGTKFSIRVTQPGTIHYFCSIHPWMKAEINVGP